MPQGEIYLDLDQLESEVITQTSSKLAEIDSAMERACNIVATLTVCGWNGEAKDSFLRTFTEYKSEMRIFYENLSAFKKVLEDIHDKGGTVLEQGQAISSAL